MTGASCGVGAAAADGGTNIRWTQPRQPKGPWPESKCAIRSVNAASANGFDTRPTWLLCTATFSVFSPSTVQLRQCKIPSLREKMAVAGTGSGFRSVSSTSSARSVTPKTCTALLKEKPCDAGTFALRAPGRTHHDHMTNLVAVLMGEPAAQQAAEAPADEGQLLVVTLRKAHHRSEGPSRTLSVIPNGRPTRTPWT